MQSRILEDFKKSKVFFDQFNDITQNYFRAVAYQFFGGKQFPIHLPTEKGLEILIGSHRKMLTGTYSMKPDGMLTSSNLTLPTESPTSTIAKNPLTLFGKPIPVATSAPTPKPEGPNRPEGPGRKK